MFQPLPIMMKMATALIQCMMRSGSGCSRGGVLRLAETLGGAIRSLLSSPPDVARAEYACRHGVRNPRLFTKLPFVIRHSLAPNHDFVRPITFWCLRTWYREAEVIGA